MLCFAQHITSVLLFTDMSGGELAIIIAVAVIFGAGIFFGIKLYRWNNKDRKK